MNNRYSTTWFERFLRPIQPVQTEQEIAFVARQLPRPVYTTVLDLCCGWGRHARLLAEKGYQVTGVDRDTAALAEAGRRSGGAVAYLERDMRDLSALPGSFDAVVSLWQSFGYFDEATNTDILRQIERKLNPRGRLVLDLYHRVFFERHQGTRQFERDGPIVVEKKSMIGNRLTVTLDYGPGCEMDTFDWQLYTPDEICEIAARSGFVCLMVCSGFDEKTPASAESPRMQVVCEKKQ